MRKSSTPGLSSSFGRIRPPVSVPSFPRAASFEAGIFAAGLGAALGAGTGSDAGAGAGTGSDAGAGTGAGTGTGAGLGAGAESAFA